MPAVKSLVALAGRAVGADGHATIQELEAASVPEDLMLLVHSHMELEMLIDCVVHGVVSTWRLLQTRSNFDAIFEHRFLEYCHDRDQYREKMRSSFLTACDLDAGEFYPLQHSRFQFAPLIVEEHATDGDVAALVGAPVAVAVDSRTALESSDGAASVDTANNDWAVAGPAVYGARGRDGSVREKIKTYDAKHADGDGDHVQLSSDTMDLELRLDASGWYHNRFRLELQTLLWLARSIYTRCKAVEKPHGMQMIGGLDVQPARGKSIKSHAGDCICRTPPWDWQAEALPCKLGTARLFGGTGEVLLKALRFPHLLRYQQKLAIFSQMGTQEEQAAAAAGQRIPSLASITSLDLSGLGVIASAVLCDSLLSGCPQLTHLVRPTRSQKPNAIVRFKCFGSAQDLSGCRHVDNRVLAATGTLPQLRKLAVCGCREFDDDGLKQVRR
jgi:hypothetical protein